MIQCGPPFGNWRSSAYKGAVGSEGGDLANLQYSRVEISVRTGIMIDAYFFLCVFFFLVLAVELRDILKYTTPTSKFLHIH